MHIERVELTLSHVDLGHLTEFAAMVLFGNAYSHRITHGHSDSIRELCDAAGAQLYPAYFYTHLRVPEGRPLERYQVWDHVDVGVDVRAFGSMITDSRYVLADEGELDEAFSDWDDAPFPTLRAGNMFILEAERSRLPQSGVPRAGLVAPLPKLTSRPDAPERFTKAQSQGVGVFGHTMTEHEPLRYELLEGRDRAPGHALMYGTFIRIFEHAERRSLVRLASPPPRGNLSLVERETYYLANHHSEDPLLCFADPRALENGDIGFVVEIRDSATRSLMAISRSRKRVLRDVKS